MDGPTDRGRPETEFGGQSLPRRGRAPAAVWVVGLALVALVAIVGRGVVPPAPEASPVPAVAVASATATASATASSAAPSPDGRVVLVQPHGAIATLVNDVLLVSGTVDPGIDTLEVTVTNVATSVVGRASVGPLAADSGEFQADIPIRNVQRTQWLFIEITALDATGAPLEIVRRAVQVASLDPTA